MTRQEFDNSGCYNKHCEVTFRSGKIISGIIAEFLNDSDEYQLIFSKDLIKYKELEQKDIKEAQALLKDVNFDDIVAVKLLP